MGQAQLTCEGPRRWIALSVGAISEPIPSRSPGRDLVPSVYLVCISHCQPAAEQEGARGGHKKGRSQEVASEWCCGVVVLEIES